MKGYPGYGPNRCTKMKVFRPKTCGHIKTTDDEEALSSFDKKWRFIRQSKVTPMDLAICWDMTPEDPLDEPKKPTHVDGSNGSAAPAVFSLIHTPKNEEDTPKCDGIHGCGPLFDCGTKENKDKEYFFHRSKQSPRGSNESKKSGSISVKKRAKSAYTAEPDKGSIRSDHSEKRAKSAHPTKHRSHDSNNSVVCDKNEVKNYAISANNHNSSDMQSLNSKEHLSSLKSRAKSAYNLNDIRKSNSKMKECNTEVYNNIHHSTPNLSEQEKYVNNNCCKHLSSLPNNRLCVACELRNMSLTEERPKTEYKMAFKAGVPQKNVSRCYSYVLKVPKQKNPYRLRNYVIDSLAPPFCLQKTRRHEYPEHWRLATVYQHSYKPIHARKRPLLQTVFK